MEQKYNYKVFENQTTDGVSKEFKLSGETQLEIYGVFDGAQAQLQFNPIDGEDIWVDSDVSDILNEDHKVARMESVTMAKFRFRLFGSGANTNITLVVSNCYTADSDEF